MNNDACKTPRGRLCIKLQCSQSHYIRDLTSKVAQRAALIPLQLDSLQLVSCTCRFHVLRFGTAMQVSSQVMQYACTCLHALMCLCCSGAGRTRAPRPCHMQAATQDTPSPAPVRAAVRYQGIHHAGFLVQDTAKSVKWYRSILGEPPSMPVTCFTVPRLIQYSACRHGGQR